VDQVMFCGHSGVFSGIWPSSGMTRGGVAYALPTWARRTPGSGSLSLLKTPTSQLATNGGAQHPDKRKAGGHGPTLADEIEHLLPTPTAMDSHSSGGSTPSHVTLTDAVVQTQLGARTNPRFDVGSTSQDALPLPLASPDAPESD
jgi:hypothetical protein